MDESALKALSSRLVDRGLAERCEFHSLGQHSDNLDRSTMAMPLARALQGVAGVSVVFFGPEMDMTEALRASRRLLESWHPVVFIVASSIVDLEFVKDLAAGVGYQPSGVCFSRGSILELIPVGRQHKATFDVAAYWEDRYSRGGTSGVGSYNRLAAFKAEVINRFIQENSVASVLELGSGDGNQAALLMCPRYRGLDISPTAVQRCQRIFAGDDRRSFGVYDPGAFSSESEASDLVLSLDVLYHLSADDVYDRYLAHLFSAARRYVIIYSNDTESHPAAGDSRAEYVRFRRFTADVERLAPGWRRVDLLPNRYPYNPTLPKSTSYSDFYLFSRDGDSASLHLSQPDERAVFEKTLMAVQIGAEQVDHVHGTLLDALSQTRSSVSEVVKGASEVINTKIANASASIQALSKLLEGHRLPPDLATSMRGINERVQELLAQGAETTSRVALSELSIASLRQDLADLMLRDTEADKRTVSELNALCERLASIETELENTRRMLGRLDGFLSQSPAVQERLEGIISQSLAILDRLGGFLSQLPGVLERLDSFLSKSPEVLRRLDGFLSQSPGVLERLDSFLSMSPEVLRRLDGFLSQSPADRLRYTEAAIKLVYRKQHEDRAVLDAIESRRLRVDLRALKKATSARLPLLRKVWRVFKEAGLYSSRQPAESLRGARELLLQVAADPAHGLESLRAAYRSTRASNAKARQAERRPEQPKEPSILPTAHEAAGPAKPATVVKPAAVVKPVAVAKPSVPRVDHSRELSVLLDSVTEYCHANPSLPLVVINSTAKSFRETKHISYRATFMAQVLRDLQVPTIFSYYNWDADPPVEAGQRPPLFEVPADRLIDLAPLFTMRAIDNPKLFVLSIPDLRSAQIIEVLRLAGFTVAYDVWDDHALFARMGLAKWFDPAIERHLALVSDHVFTVCPGLSDKMRSIGVPDARLHLLSNGVPEAWLVQDLGQVFQQRQKSQVVGYVGNISGNWFDWRAVRAMAMANPKLTIELIGPITANGHPADLPANIRLLGPISNEDAFRHARSWRAGLVPHVMNDHIRNADSIKVYEYLGAGLPVVTIHKEFLSSYPLVFTYREPGDAPEALAAALATSFVPALADRWRAFIEEKTWTSITRQLLRTAGALQ